MNEMTTPAGEKKLVSQDLEVKIMDLVKQADNMIVTDRFSWNQADEFIRNMCNPVIKEIEECFDGPIADANKLHKSLCSKRKKYLESPTTAKEIADRKMKNWDLEERRRIEEKERKERAEREKAEREARLKAEREERDRQAAREAAEKAANRELEDRLLQEAIEAEKQGNKEKAEAILNKEIKPVKVEVPMQAPPPPTPIATEQPKPEEKRDTVRSISWKFRFVDVQAVNRPYLVPDEIAIGKIVRSLGMKAVQEVGGIEVYEDINYQRRNQ